jgi:hypothetical protein
MVATGPPLVLLLVLSLGVIGLSGCTDFALPQCMSSFPRHTLPPSTERSVAAMQLQSITDAGEPYRIAMDRRLSRDEKRGDIGAIKLDLRERHDHNSAAVESLHRIPFPSSIRKEAQAYLDNVDIGRRLSQDYVRTSDSDTIGRVRISRDLNIANRNTLNSENVVRHELGMTTYPCPYTN